MVEWVVVGETCWWLCEWVVVKVVKGMRLIRILFEYFIVKHFRWKKFYVQSFVAKFRAKKFYALFFL